MAVSVRNTFFAGTLLDEDRNYYGTIGKDGIIRDSNETELGRVDNAGQVFDTNNMKKGKIDTRGRWLNLFGYVIGYYLPL